MEKELIEIAQNCYSLGYRYLTKDMDGDVHVWGDVPVLEDGRWLDVYHTGFAWGFKIDKLGKCVDHGKLRFIEEIIKL